MQAIAPKVYPQCGMCRQPFALRHRMTITFATGNTTAKWVWVRDCKCNPRRAKPPIYDIIVNKRKAG